jgi:hypothetical protein
MGTLTSRAEALDAWIRQLANDLKAREDELRKDARLTLGLKKAFSILGTVLERWPVSQPAVGLPGAGLATAMKFDEQDSLEDAIRSGNLAAEVLDSSLEQAMDDFDIIKSAPDATIGGPLVLSQEALEVFDADMAGLTGTLKAVQSWDGDLDREVQSITAEDPIHQDIVGSMTALNQERKRFAEDLADLSKTARDQMGRLHEILLAANSLDQAIASGEIDQEGHRHIREMGQRQEDRLLEYLYYLLKAYQYRTLRPYPDKDVFNLDKVHEHFDKYYEGEVPAVAGAPVLPRDVPDNLGVILGGQLQVIRAAIVGELLAGAPDNFREAQVLLDRDHPDLLAALNGWDDGSGASGEAAPSGYPLRLDLMDLGVLDPNHENQRIYRMWVKELAAAPTGGPARDMTLTIQPSGESRIDFEGNIYKFVYRKTVSGPTMTWGARYKAGGTFTDDGRSVSGGSLLGSLIGAGEPFDLLTYSRPGAWTDLLISKSTLNDASSATVMKITKLTLGFKIEEQIEAEGQDRNELNVLAASALGVSLAPCILVETPEGVEAGDTNQRADGFAPFRRVYASPQDLVLKAPRTHGALTFDRWEDDMGGTVGAGPAVTVLPGTYRAVYVKAAVRFRRGDSNADGTTDISDAIAILGYLFQGGSRVPCEQAGDANDDGKLDISDAITVLSFLFSGGKAIKPPLTCGVDPSGHDLPCRSFPGCQ